MTTIETRPHLRLVGASEDWPTTDEHRRHEIAAENRRAAANPTLDPTDPRWVLAVRAYSQLQGSAMTWDRRQRVLDTADRLGVRPFDANLIIAIVQDHARRGRALDEAAGTLALLDPPAATSRDATTLRWLAAIATAIVANAFLIWWLLG